MQDTIVVGTPPVEEEGANSSFSEGTDEDQLVIYEGLDDDLDEGDNDKMMED